MTGVAPPTPPPVQFPVPCVECASPLSDPSRAQSCLLDLMFLITPTDGQTAVHASWQKLKGEEVDFASQLVNSLEQRV